MNYREKRKEHRIFSVSLTLTFGLMLAFAAEWLAGSVSYSGIFFSREKENSSNPISSPLNENGAGEASSELPPSYLLLAASDTTSAIGLYDSLYSGKSDTVKAAGTYSIVTRNLSGLPEKGQILMSNQTNYSPDLSAILSSIRAENDIRTVFSAKKEYSEPLVLIVHTHGTEGYAAEGVLSYPENALPRSAEITENVVAVGETVSEILNESGIPTIHCEIMHDKDSYVQSYDLCRQTILKYLKEYPTIRCVLDIHRDALLTQEGEIIKTLTFNSTGEATAQVMLVVGTDQNGADHKNWMENLTLAVALQDAMNERCPDIARPINLRPSSFNEQYTSGSLLVEIGTCANTLEEAKRGAAVFAETLAQILLS